MSKTLIADRYELLEEIPRVSRGQLFRARDQAFAEMVGVRLLGPQCGLNPRDRRRLESIIRRLQGLPHPHLVRTDSFEPETGVLIQEWIQGISLLDLLRRQRELSASEVLRLLADLPATLDFLVDHKAPWPRPLLGKLFIQDDGTVFPDSVATASGGDWPSSALKLNPLNLRLLFANRGEATDTDVADPQSEDRDGPRQFASLLYELLGGRGREVNENRCSPLAALRESGNAVLRRSLIAAPHADCRTLWHELIDAQSTASRTTVAPIASGLPAVQTLRVPEPLPSDPHPGSVLMLQPQNSTLAIHLVAGSRFKIGRSLQQADFPTRIQPENEANDLLTNRLSRVHVILEKIGGELHVRDGNGSGPSLNGSTIDGQSLLPDRPTPLRHRVLLELGEEYALELIPLAHARQHVWSFGKLGLWPQPERSQGESFEAVVCHPARDQPTLRHSAWLFTEAGFGLDCCGQLIWDTRNLAEHPAAFHYAHGGFWLRNGALPETTQVCMGTPLPRDAVAPLHPGQTLHIGVHVFTVEIV